MMLSLRKVIFASALLWMAHQADSGFAAAEGTIDLFSGKPCYRCHLSKVSGPGLHSALEENRCTPCHKFSNGNHQANRRFSEVKDRTARLCYECHDDQSHQKSVHPPIIAHECLGCHAPHASPHGNLLKVTLGRLCFECHARTLVNEETTVQATGFRDGNSNLHYLHARKSELPCLTCHQAHASSQEYLLRTTGSSGKNLVTLTYQATATGGSCTSSCHDAAEYVRK